MISTQTASPVSEKNNTQVDNTAVEILQPKTEVPVPKPSLNIENTLGSALSLKSIQQKKAFTKKKKIIVEDDPEKLPKDPFTQEKILKLWNDYGKRMDKKGERIIGSMFAMNKPKLLDNFVLEIELANETMRIDIENISAPLLAHLNEELNNYSITIKIEVNEAAAVKHAFTPEDKYEKLKEKNPLIDKLRAKFDLDL